MSCGSGFVGALCELFVPTVGLGGRMDALRGTLEGKFPFSLASALGSFFTGAPTGETALPANIGFITLPWTDAAMLDFFGVVKVCITILIGAGLAWWLVDRLTPQAVM